MARLGTAGKIRALIDYGECADRREAILYLWDSGEIGEATATRLLEREDRAGR